MARKRSIGGRSRISTPASRLLRSIEQVNKKLNQLESKGVYGKYAAKKLLATVGRESGIKYNRSKRQKISVDINKLKPSQIRYYQRVFDSFTESKTSSPIGVLETQNKARESLKQSLGRITDSDITEQDIEDFYDLVSDSDFKYLADKIGPSEVYILLNEIKNRGGNENDFISLLNQYMTTNNEDARNKASNIYNKFVRS